MTEKKKPSCLSVKIDLNLSEKLRKDLENQDFSFSHPPYTIFNAVKKGISVTLYQSGKLTVQGKEKEPFIEFYLEPEILRSFSYSYPELGLDMTPRIGVDEAGKGDFFGALCTCALYADEEGMKELLDLGVKDSKRLSDAAVLKLGQKLEDKFATAIIKIYPAKYNELYLKFHNLNSLLAWTHAAAIKELFEKTGCTKVIIDQFASKHVMEQMLQRKKIPLVIDQRTKGENDIVVAAASIIARKQFLQSLKTLEEQYQLTLPKGASSIVIKAGEKIISSRGVEILDQVSKSHFKTRNQIVQNYQQDNLPM